MKFSENFAHIAAAFCKFQGMVKNPPKNKIAKIPTKSGGSYSYKYADLADITEAIREPMKNCGLSYIQNPIRNERNELAGVYTILIHESGETIEFDPVPIRPEDTTAQKTGSALTYARRYSLSLALGIAADEDDDAVSTQPPQEKQTQKQQPKQTQQKNEQPKHPAQQPEQPASDQTQSEERNLNTWNNLAYQNQEQQRKPQGLATEKQLNKLYAVAKTLGVSNKDMKEIVMARTGKQTSKELTSKEASELIKYLENDLKAELEKKQDQEAEEAYTSFERKLAGDK